MKHDKPVIKVDNLRKVYGNRVVLDDVSFSIPAGHVVGIIGPNGSGKTTLANILLGFDTDFHGTVRVDESLRIAYIPQFAETDKYSLPLSVYEFIRSTANKFYGLRNDASIDTVVQTLAHVGLDEQKLHQDIYSLSGGERQRVAIARALLNDPNIMVLDEPLASVDYASRQDLYRLLHHLNRTHGITLVLISHDMDSVLSISDSVLYLYNGAVREYRPSDFASEVRTPTCFKIVCRL